LKIGSRGSQLALWQANHISALLSGQGHEVEIEIIHTTGDKITDVALAKVGAKGMFTKEIEEALADRRVDLAVHSLKDLPTELSVEFEIAAVPAREDPRDAFCSVEYSSVHDLPHGGRVDLVVHPLRGNVDTRLRKLESAEYDAIILASAGLRRLGKTERVRQILSVDLMCPAAGQGALGIETRAGDAAVREALAFLDDASARAETVCERALLAKLGGGCQVPIGANARFNEGSLHLEAVVASPDGTLSLRASAAGSDPTQLGEEVGEDLLRRGGDKILDQVYGRSAVLPQQP
jgi:hydroxymethylbilane synthase